MTPERWQQIEQLFHAALERAPAERAAFLAEVCAGDEPLRRELDSLLAAHERTEDFIETAAADVAADLLAEGRGELAAGAQIDHYRIVSLLGLGGMGEVYLAEDTRLGRRIALKRLPAQFTTDTERVRRFEQEARAALALNHPNIVTIHEIGHADATHFIATEFIDGVTLREHMAGRALELGAALDIAAQIAAALAAAHVAGIVHRDIKPENVMLRRDGIVKVLDFGLAKLTRQPAATVEMKAQSMVKTGPGMVLGTVSYMSPEQAQGQEVDARADIWSLGCVLYEMLTGHVPFTGKTPGHMLVSILESEPQPLADCVADAPPELERIVGLALRKDREERYQTSGDLLADLKQLRQQMELAAALERSESTEQKSAARPAAVRAALGTPAADRLKPARALPRSLAAHVKRHGRVAVLALALLLLAAPLALFLLRRPGRALTEKDSIVLADMTNTTGDPVFDDTLKQALALHLEQSPFLNILPDQRVRETLRYMGRSPDERVTKDLAREVCARQGVKALLAGSIANVGSHFVVGLEAVNARTGAIIAREQVETASKEQVLGALGVAASRLREKLGESLSSVQKFDAPVEQATTSSLEALQAFSLGNAQRLRGKYPEAIPFYRHAVELDPGFALAYARLASMYSNTRQLQLAAEASQKAFDLRGRVSEREQLYISYSYYSNVTRELDKQIEVLELLKELYPRDPIPHNALAYIYLALGPAEQAVAEARAATQLDPALASARGNLASALLSLNRFDEAKAVLDESVAQKMDSLAAHSNLYTIAFINGDQAALSEQLHWAGASTQEHEALYWQGQAAAFAGQLKRARELYAHAAELAQSRAIDEHIAGHTASLAWKEAAFGDCAHAAEDTAKALALARNDFITGTAAGTLIMCNEPARAQPLLEELTRRNPKDTRVNVLLLPTMRAAVQTRRGNPVEAIKLLQPTGRYELGSYFAFWVIYTRGQAYLRARAGAEAAQEFQKILTHRGIDAMSAFYPLAHLGEARAAALTGDTAKARQSYQSFFALWQAADPDLPVLLEARKEYERLK